MTDNVEMNAGSGGATIRTDDDGTAHWQYVKVAYGADNTQNIVTSTATNPLPVALSDTDNTVLDNIQTAVQLIDNAVSGTGFNISQLGGASVPIGGGTEAAAVRVTLANDSTGTVTVDNAGTFATQATCTNAGTFAVQEDGAALTALQLIDNTVYVDDADWTALTSSHNLIGGLYQSTPGTITDGDTGPIRLDANGAVHINDGGNSITVDGTVTANAGTGTFTVDGSGVTQPVSGTVTANLSATDNAVLDQIQANTANLNNAIVQDDTPFTPATGYLMMIGGEYDDSGTDSIDEGDAGNIRISARREMYVQLRDAAGNERGLNIDTNGAIGVTNAGITTIAGAVAGSEMQVDVVASLPAGTNAIGKLAANSGVDIGDVDVTSISAGSNLIGDVGISGARTSGGTTLYKNIDVDETEDQVKATAGQIYWIHAINVSSGVRYLKVYNATAASVTVGTTTPDLTFPIPTQGDTNGAGFTLSIPNGIAFSTAITIAATTGVADADTGAPGANEVIVNLGYA